MKMNASQDRDEGRLRELLNQAAPSFDAIHAGDLARPTALRKRRSTAIAGAVVLVGAVVAGTFIIRAAASDHTATGYGGPTASPTPISDAATLDQLAADAPCERATSSTDTADQQAVRGFGTVAAVN